MTKLQKPHRPVPTAEQRAEITTRRAVRWAETQSRGWGRRKWTSAAKHMARIANVTGGEAETMLTHYCAIVGRKMALGYYYENKIGQFDDTKREHLPRLIEGLRAAEAAAAVHMKAIAEAAPSILVSVYPTFPIVPSTPDRLWAEERDARAALIDRDWSGITRLRQAAETALDEARKNKGGAPTKFYGTDHIARLIAQLWTDATRTAFGWNPPSKRKYEVHRYPASDFAETAMRDLYPEITDASLDAALATAVTWQRRGGTINLDEDI